MKKKKVLAGILGAVMVAGVATSFAYFTGTNDGIGDGDSNKIKAIQITNGKVEVSAKVETNHISGYQWSYDVAKHSGATAEKDASPDINAVDKVTDTAGISRAKIGSKLPTPVVNTRPGDAIVLGVPGVNGEAPGLIVTNKSNLTVKVQLVVKNDDDAKAELAKLVDAGWQVYVDDKPVDLTKTQTVDLAVLTPGSTSNHIDIRFELPLGTDNTYQSKSTATGVDTGFDLNKLVEIQATQENNPGWTEDGK